MRIQKRDGRIVEFNAEKITGAMEKAFRQIVKRDLDVSENKKIYRMTYDTISKIQELDENVVSVEKIQDMVEQTLMEHKHFDVTKEYILYRNKRTKEREGRSELYEVMDTILVETNKDNANISNSPSAKMLQIGSLASTRYYLNKIIPRYIARMHEDKEIHIHDLDFYGKTMTCLQIPLGKLLTSGFDNGHGFIRPPKRAASATALSAIILQSNQNDMFGGQAYAFFDRDLAQFAEKEYQYVLNEELENAKFYCQDAAMDRRLVEERAWNKTRENVFQAMEGLVYNLNTMHSRAGAQVPFSSIALGTDITKFGRLVTEQFLLAYEKGLGRGEQPIFPNVAFKLKKGINVNEEDPNYDLFKLSMRVLSTRLFPSFINLDASFNAIYEDDVAYMG